MKLALIILSIVALAGCTTAPVAPRAERIIVKQKLVPITVPSELLEIPQYPDAVNPKTMTDKELALWLIENEKRNQEIEKRLKAIKQYQDQRLKGF